MGFPTSTQAEYLSMGFPTSTQAEYLSMVRCKIYLYTGYFVICSDLYTGGMKLKNLTSTQVERSFEKWRSVSFTDAVVHCPDFGSKSKVYRSRPSPIICGRQQGVQDVGLSSILF
ncbi:hypothetical protein TNCV_881 [Trichonephila clavipes]|nr:hypothetical protein TNCV_881 [Trichonephila clavipes]